MSSRKVALSIIDLACGGGGTLVVEHMIKELPGVIEVYVNPATETAYVEYEPERLSEEEMARTVNKVGTRHCCQAECSER